MLTELKIKSIHQAGRYSDGRNLYLKVSTSLRKRWVCRIRVSGKRRELGLGSYPNVGLKEARKKRDAVGLQVSRGDDPLALRAAQQNEMNLLNAMTFKKATLACFEIKQAEWKNGKHQDQWINTLTT